MLRKLLIGASAVGMAALAACSTGSTQAASSPVVNTSALPTGTSSAPAPTTSSVAPTTTTTITQPPKVTVNATSSTHSATSTTPPPKPAAAVAGTPCTSSASACVDISRDKAWLLQDGKVVYGPVSITSGKSGHRTPTGSFTVLWKDIDHKSKEFDDAPMPYSVFFYPGDAFHTGSLRAESHGCIHLANSVAKRFYRFLSVGDRVQVRP